MAFCHRVLTVGNDAPRLLFGYMKETVTRIREVKNLSFSCSNFLSNCIGSRWCGLGRVEELRGH